MQRYGTRYGKTQSMNGIGLAYDDQNWGIEIES